MISAVPPLSKPSPVRVTGANAHSIWVEWDKITKDSNNIPLEPDHQVTYLLFMRNSFQLLSVEDRVIATLPRSTTGDKSMTKPSSSKTLKVFFSVANRYKSVFIVAFFFLFRMLLQICFHLKMVDLYRLLIQIHQPWSMLEKL